MAKHIQISRVQTVQWQCDACGSAILPDRRPPARCHTCGKDLCRSCKRFIHVEAGNGAATVPHQTNLTHHYCPEHYLRVVEPLLAALACKGDG